MKIDNHIYSNVFENPVVAITITDKNERVKIWNKYAESLYGTKNLHNVQVKSLYPKEEWKRLRKENIRKKGLKHHFEIKINKSKYIDLSITILKDKNKKIIGSIGFARDITIRKKAQAKLARSDEKLRHKSVALEKAIKNLYRSKEELLKKSNELQNINLHIKKINRRLKSSELKLMNLSLKLEDRVKERTKELQLSNIRVLQLLNQKKLFINQIAHDLKTPLTPIISLLEISLIDNNRRKNKERLSIALKNSHYLQNLLIDILSISRLDTYTLKFNFELCDINKIIWDIVKSHEINFNERKISISTNLGKKLDPLLVDKIKIREVIENILKNALNYMKDGKSINIATEQNKNELVISIKDQGIGISKKNLTKIFEEFFKVDQSRHEHTSGLGLAICKRIVNSQNGKIWAESSGLGKGSTFFISLPRQLKKSRKSN